jgi:RNA polymerase sigma-70 factor, ECF subfamily
MLAQTETPISLTDMDQRAFAALVETHQRELRAHCYRMLGSLQEAEEAVQETFWRAWDRRETYQGRASVRAWLFKIATNLSIDSLRQRPRRALPVSRSPVSSPQEPIPADINEPIWLEPYPLDYPAPEDENPEARYSLYESIQLAFLASLHLLPPRQRAVLILCDVLDWPASEVADTLGQTVPSVKSALHRARTTLAQRRPALQTEIIPGPTPEETIRSRLDSYVKAWETADVDGLVALMREDCAFSMPPIPSWYSGREQIAALVRMTIFSGQASGRWRLAPTRANAQPGFGLYRWDAAKGIYAAYGVQVVTLAGEQIADITTFRTPALLPFFNLPVQLPSKG